MSGLNLNASVNATLARDNEPWTMPPCVNPDCPVGCPDSHCAPYELLDDVVSPCPEFSK